MRFHPLAPLALPLLGFVEAKNAQNARYVVLFEEEKQVHSHPSYKTFLTQKKVEHDCDIVAEFNNINGFVVDVDSTMSNAFVNLLQEDPLVKIIEPDIPMHATEMEVQHDAEWHLDILDEPNASQGFDNKYHYQYDGDGVWIFIADTGMRLSHDEFENRARCGKSTIETDDCSHGGANHANHVASLAAGKTYGVAKKAEIVNVKVLDSNGNGSLVSVLAGIDYIISEKNKKPEQPMVANFSLGGGRSFIMDAYIEKLRKAGVPTFVAAGNDATNACFESPAGSAASITISATNKEDEAAWFANEGPCVTLFAPGVALVGAGVASDSATVVLSGTSMASPLGAGIAALHLQRNRALTPDQVESIMVDDAVDVVRVFLPDTTTLLVNVASLLETEPATPAPTEIVEDPVVSSGKDTNGVAVALFVVACGLLVMHIIW